jgi:hypothetical protein
MLKKQIQSLQQQKQDLEMQAYQAAKEVPEVTKEAPENMFFLERNNLRGLLLSKEKGFETNSS